MKPTFKTTALAILVSLGAVACSSNSSHDGAQPVKVTKPAEAAKPAEATKPVEAIKPVEAAKFNFKKEATLANGKEWRYIDFSDTSIASIVSGLKDGIDRHITGSHGVGAGIINFNKLSNYSTGEFTGLDKDETYSLDNNVFINGLYYHFINQPY